VAMVAVAHVISVVHVQLAELDRPVSSGDSAWFHPPTFVTGLLMTLAWVVLGAVALSLRPPERLPDAVPRAHQVSPETSAP